MTGAALTFWPEEAIEAMHQASLALLARAGVRVESPAARDVFLAAGCTLSADDRVLIPPQAVEDAIAALPASAVLAARDPGKSLELDASPGPVYVHNMGGAADVADARTGELRRATLADQVALTRVMHHLVNQHEVTSLVQPQDVPALLEPLYSYLVLALESDKALGGPGVSHPFQARYLEEMAMVVTGADGADGTFPIDIAFSPVSPLILGGEVTDALLALVATRRSIVEILPCPAVATTAPASIAGAVAQQNAEVLAGLVLVQLAAPGTPVYYGPRLSAVDPRSGVFTSGTPETGVASLAAVLLARRYRMPCDCYGPTTDSKVVDTQYGYEHALNAMIAMLGRPRLLSGIGDIQAGVATNLSTLVVDDEILNYCFYVLEQRPWDADALDVDAMVEGVLSGRGFLGARHTRRYIRSELVRPLLSYRGGLGEWLAAGRHGLEDLAEQKVARLLEEDRVGLPDDVQQALCGLIDRAAREVGLDEWPDPRAVPAGVGV